MSFNNKINVDVILYIKEHHAYLYNILLNKKQLFYIILFTLYNAHLLMDACAILEFSLKPGAPEKRVCLATRQADFIMVVQTKKHLRND